MAHSSISMQMPDCPISNPGEHRIDVEDIGFAGSVLVERGSTAA